MTCEQHEDAAYRIGLIVRVRLAQAVSDHPFDNDQDECAATSLAWAVIAAHHALAAQTCDMCNGTGSGIPFPPEAEVPCDTCDGAGWIPRAT